MNIREMRLNNILNVIRFESDDVMRMFLGSVLGQRPAFDTMEEDLDLSRYFHLGPNVGQRHFA